MRLVTAGGAAATSGRRGPRPARRRKCLGASGTERVAVTITGHRTRSVFDRYHIISPADLQAATRRLAEADGHVSGHVRAAALDGRLVTTENA